MGAPKFELDLKHAAGPAVRELVQREAQRARDLLLADGEGGTETVHEFRKSMKGLRALARLVRKRLGSQFDPCNRALRDAGRLLSDLRDQDATLEALRALRTDLLEQTERAALEDAERHLSRKYAGSSHKGLPERIKLALESLDRGSGLLERVHLDSYEDLSDGLGRVCRAASKRLRRVQERRDDVRLHDLRKRTKDHRFHLDLLKTCAPTALEAERKMADDVSELLGLDHDLAVLLPELRALELDPAAAIVLERLISKQRAEHQQEALELAEQLFRERPKDKAARIIGYVLHASLPEPSATL